MVAQIVTVATLIIGGAMLADLLAPSHLAGTKALIGGVQNIWGNSLKAVAGQKI